MGASGFAEAEMMSPTIVLAIAVAVGEAKNPSTLAMLAAARESLSPGSVVRVVERADLRNVDARAIESDLAAGATVVLLWADPARLHSVMRVHFSASDRWFSRQMDFVAADTPSERGRTLGLAAASIWPDARLPESRRLAGVPSPPPPREAEAPERWVPEATPGRASPEADADADANANEIRNPGSQGSPTARPEAGPIERERTTDSDEAGVDRSSPSPRDPEPARSEPDNVRVRRRPARRPPAGPPAPHTVAAEIGAFGTTGLGSGSANGLGGELRGIFFPVSLGLGICAGVGWRTGAVPGFGTDSVASVAFGLEWWPGDDGVRSGARSPVASRWTFGLRLQALGVYHRVRADEPPELHSLTLPGADLRALVRLRLSRTFQLVAAVGSEAVLGDVHIDRHVVGDPEAALPVTTIPALRAVGEVGVRVTF